MTKRVEIDVDQLVLHGLRAGQRQAVQGAVERELTRLLTRGEITRGEIAPGRQLQIPEIRLPREGTRS